MNTFVADIEAGKRFQFGKNWSSFLSTLTEEKIAIAQSSLLDMLQVQDLSDKSFLDIGSGSGLFSLAARRLGAQVYSFDYDPESVACALQLRETYFPGDDQWIIKEGSVLDGDYVRKLGEFDVVYSWGVLHHTGNMWTALNNAAWTVRENGMIYIAIYNDQGRKSQIWKRIKTIYCSGFIGKALVSSVFVPYYFISLGARCLRRKENLFAAYKDKRGMSVRHDWFDWLGGLPFEVASAAEIFRFFRARGFSLRNISTTNGSGNNEFVFTKE